MAVIFYHFNPKTASIINTTSISGITSTMNTTLFSNFIQLNTPKQLKNKQKPISGKIRYMYKKKLTRHNSQSEYIKYNSLTTT